jgi:hypothetical protein
MTCFNKQYSAIQLRRGLDAEFISLNIILASGEPAFAVDTNILKIGDGITSWNELPTPSSSGAIFYSGSGINFFFDDLQVASGNFSDLTIAGNNPSISFGAGDNQDVYLLTESGNFVLDENNNKLFLYNLADNTVLFIGVDNSNNTAQINSIYPLTISNNVDISTQLTVNNTPVSVSGHPHVSADITDFDTTVSGIVMTILNQLNLLGY